VGLKLIFYKYHFKWVKFKVAIAKVGYDTPHHKASTEVYDKLPGCCKYDRDDNKK